MFCSRRRDDNRSSCLFLSLSFTIQEPRLQFYSRDPTCSPPENSPSFWKGKHVSFHAVSLLLAIYDSDVIEFHCKCFRRKSTNDNSIKNLVVAAYQSKVSLKNEKLPTLHWFFESHFVVNGFESGKEIHIDFSLNVSHFPLVLFPRRITIRKRLSKGESKSLSCHVSR